MRIIVSGGGTAGHITPALAVCDALKLRAAEQDLSLLYVGEKNSMEARIVGAAGIAFVSIKAGKFRRNQSAGTPLILQIFNAHTLYLNVRDLFRVGLGILGSIKILRSFKPDVIFLKGGFVCLPVGIAAKLLKIPYIIHESDVVPGLANKILSRWAEIIAVGFPVKSYPTMSASKLRYVGNPVRPVKVAHRFEGLAKFGFDDALPVVFITGGSQGAAKINAVVSAALPELTEFAQVIHQTGENEFARINFEISRGNKLEHNKRYFAAPFLMGQDMVLAMAACDILVGRAGIGTISDAASLAKPLILIPNNAMAAHQMANAKVLSRLGAARVLNNDTITPQGLVGELRSLFGNKQERDRLSKAIQAFDRPTAAGDIANLLVGMHTDKRGEI